MSVDDLDLKKNIFPVDISSEMKDSYLQYSMSVIVGRALPDVRDGLKPVHRRVLFAMRDLNNTHEGPYKKSARVVGDVIGKYHPHGESAVYDTIVRMAQDFSMNHILVDGQGNFGSIDGDSAAASRYTEIRMTQLASELLKDIEKETVNFEWNYDDTLLIPTVLPAQFPNLLVNGSSGIAVGMASNIPPHNLGEVVSVCIQLLDTDLSISDILQKIPGPDFPTSGSILGQSGITKAYQTGRGVIVLRAKAEIEEAGAREQIIVTELPYQVNKANLIESIATLVRDKKIEGISDIRDESSREGMRIVIILKRKENASVILNNLYKQTKLQNSFGIHLLALDHQCQPQTFSIKSILLAFLSHRRDVVTRRLIFDLMRAKERMHILEGLTKALDNLDEVISLIRASKETAQAKQGLIEKFELSVLQAQAILDLKLHRLTGLEREKIVNEWERLKLEIKKIQDTLASPKAINEIIRGELQGIYDNFAQPRKTRIEEVEGELQDIDLIAKEEVVVLVTSQSGIKRILLDEYRLQRRGGVGLKGVEMGPDEEWIWKTLCVNTHTKLLILTNHGKAFQLISYKIPQGSRTSKSRSIKNLVALGAEEQVRSIVPIEDFSDEGSHLCMVSEQGVFKKTSLSYFAKPWKKGVTALGIKDNDKLMDASISGDSDQILILTKKGMGVKFLNKDVRLIKSRSSSGVRGITLKPEDKVIAMHNIAEDPSLLLFTVSEKGYGKLSQLDSIRLISRGGKGVRVHGLSNKTGDVAATLVAQPENQVLIVTNKGQSIRISCKDVSTQGRAASGVRLMKLKEEEFVTGMSIIDEDETDATETESTSGGGDLSSTE